MPLALSITITLATPSLRFTAAMVRDSSPAICSALGAGSNLGGLGAEAEAFLGTAGITVRSLVSAKPSPHAGSLTGAATQSVGGSSASWLRAAFALRVGSSRSGGSGANASCKTSVAPVEFTRIRPAANAIPASSTLPAMSSTRFMSLPPAFCAARGTSRASDVCRPPEVLRTRR